MNTLLKFIIVCSFVLYTSCKTNEPNENPIHEGVIPYPYTEMVINRTSSYFQVCDSIYNFNQLNGCYYYSPFHKKNLFYVTLFDSLKKSYNHVGFEMFTDNIQTEIFFQKGITEINNLSISNHCNISISLGSIHDNARLFFTWDSVLYEDRKFSGKGSFEIMDTLYTNYQDIYYPPQKIEFEFK